MAKFLAGFLVPILTYFLYKLLYKLWLTPRFHKKFILQLRRIKNQIDLIIQSSSNMSKNAVIKELKLLSYQVELLIKKYSRKQLVKQRKKGGQDAT